MMMKNMKRKKKKIENEQNNMDLDGIDDDDLDEYINVSIVDEENKIKIKSEEKN